MHIGADGRDQILGLEQRVPQGPTYASTCPGLTLLLPAGRRAVPALVEVVWDGLLFIPALQGMHGDRAGGNEKSSPKPALTKTSTVFTRSAMALKAMAPALDIEKLSSPYHPRRPGAPVI